MNTVSWTIDLVQDHPTLAGVLVLVVVVVVAVVAFAYRLMD